MLLKKLQNKIKRQWMPFIVAYVGKFCVRLLLFTCRIRIHGLNEFLEVAKHHRCILMLWHDRLVIVAEILKKYTPSYIYTAFISKSCDGEVLAIFTQSYQFGRVIRVPHNARHLALAQMIRHLKEHQEIVLITPDGPRGPRYVVKPGITLAAKKTNAQIVPFSWEASRYWCLRTWDKLMIPRPFSKINVHFGEAISLNQVDEIATLQNAMRIGKMKIML